MAFDMFDRQDPSEARILANLDALRMPPEMRAQAEVRQAKPGKPDTREGIRRRGLANPQPVQTPGLHL